MRVNNWRINKVMCSRILCLLIIINIFFIFTGCENKGYKGKHYNITSYNDFIKALDDRGYTANESKLNKDEVSESLFSVNARNINIGGETISIYEFKKSETAKSEASTISKDGNSIGDKKISWNGTPHFFQKGNLIVSYIGSNRTLFFDLSMILGNSLTERQ